MTNILKRAMQQTFGFAIGFIWGGTLGAVATMLTSLAVMGCPT